MSDVGTPSLAAGAAVDHSFVAAFIFMAWETLLSLGHEVEFIWSARRTSPTKFPFLILRWYTLFVLFILQASVTGLGFDTRFFRPPHCYAWFAFQTISLQIVLALQQYLLALRVFALYNRNRKLIKILGTLFGLLQLGSAASTVVTMPHVLFGDDGCQPLELPVPVVNFSILALLFDLLLLGLTFLKAARVWHAGARVPLLSLLVRDMTLAFLAIFVSFWTSAVVFYVLTPPLRSAGWPWLYAVCTTAACRTVLQMHASGGAPVRALMHTTATDLALTTFTAEPERDAEQLRYRPSRWDESSLYD